MKPREVFDAMRPFYPDWPDNWAIASTVVRSICHAMARHPERFRAWVRVKAPVRPLSIPELPETREGEARRHARPRSQRKAPDLSLDRKRLAAGEKENDD